MRQIVAFALLIPFFPGLRAHGAEPAPKEELVERVEKAIELGKQYLRGKQTKEEGRDKGSWEHDLKQRGGRGGATCMAVLALLTAGEDPRGAVIQDGLKYLRDMETPTDTYVVALQAMVFAEYHVQTGERGDLLRIEKNVQWLIDARVKTADGKLRGWGYGKNGLAGEGGAGGGLPDNSNTQYALLGLLAGKTAGVKIDPAVWESIREFYLRTQITKGIWEGGWGYSGGHPGGTRTMTVAGLCGLLIAGSELTLDQQKLQADGTALNCADYPENKAIDLALLRVGKSFNLPENAGAVFYNLYGVERAGRLSGQRFFDDHDWYREGCEFLTNPRNNLRGREGNEGSWMIRGQSFDSWPTISTSFALLFLSKGRTPVLVSKLVHHPADAPNNGWNNKHHDMRNLTDFVSKELFKKRPLAWQVFNARQTGRGADELTAELLQSPVAYFNGHQFKPEYFTGAERKMLKQYVEQGGFLLAEACCGREEFDRGFRQFTKEVFDDDGEHPLKLLPPNHPIYTAYYPLTFRKDRPLYGIEFGCKTLVVYSPKPLAGWWEANQPAKDADSKYAFQLGANAIAYATGMELPKPRGTQVEVYNTRPESEQKRGFLKVAQLEHPGERHSGTGVTRNLLAHLQKKMGIDVSLQTEKLKVGDKDLLNYKFVYMHGKGEFDTDAKDLKLLKANLDDGGLLFADACCGSKAFDTSFRKMIKALYGKDLEAIPVSDDLFGAAVNGTEIKTVKCRREGGDEEKGYKSVAPLLEGIKVGDRWVVIYSKYDIGCALEKHQSTDCLGHDHESALRLGSAVILYALQR